MQPLRANNPKQRVSQVVNLPSPTAGWYVGDNQATPPPKTALILDNAFPQYDYVRLRGGSQQWASGLPSSVQSLMTWTNGLASKMFAFSGNNIYDVSQGYAYGGAPSGYGPVGSPVVSGLAGSSVRSCQFQGYGGTYLIAVTGADPVHIYDGTGWDRTYALSGTLNATINVTGLSSTSNLFPGMAVSGTGIPAGTTIATIVSGTAITLSAAATVSGSKTLTFYINAPITGYAGAGFSNVWVYKGRLYFIDAQTLNVYYLGLASIGGPAYILPLHAFFKYGGYLVAGGTWSLDATSGAFLTNVFISSEGEVLIYSGDYPGATNWTTVGAYKISKPLGQNCLMQSGGDLLVMTEDGVVAMSQLMTVDQVSLENVALSRPIAPAWRTAVTARTGKTGWQIVPWPLQSMAFINLPKQSPTDYTQFVVDMRTGAWAQYLGWDVNCIAIYNNAMYFGDSNGNVWQGEVGACDYQSTSPLSAGVSYTSCIALSFSNFDAPGTFKEGLLVKSYLLTPVSGNACPGWVVGSLVSILYDYYVVVPSVPTGLNNAFNNYWASVTGSGVAISVCLQIVLNGQLNLPQISLASFDLLFQNGGPTIG